MKPQPSKIFFLLSAVVALTNLPHAVLASPDPKIFYPLAAGNFWTYKTFQFDSAGAKIERPDREEFDSVVAAQQWFGRAASLVRQKLPRRRNTMCFSFSREGNLQLFIDTSFTGSARPLDDRKTLNGFWRDVETFGDTTKNIWTSMQQPCETQIRRDGKPLTDMLGTRTHFKMFSGERAVTVPAGTFTAEVRVDSTVDQMHSALFPAVTITTISKRYYAANVGLVLEESSFRVPPEFLKVVRDSNAVLWTGWPPGEHVTELSAYHVK